MLLSVLFVASGFHGS